MRIGTRGIEADATWLGVEIRNCNMRTGTRGIEADATWLGVEIRNCNMRIGTRGRKADASFMAETAPPPKERKGQPTEATRSVPDTVQLSVPRWGRWCATV